MICRLRSDLKPGAVRVSSRYAGSKVNPLPTRTSPDRGMAMSDKGFSTISLTNLLQNVKAYNKKESTVNGAWSTGHDVTATMPSVITLAELMKNVKDIR